jgi:hypothetical protein
VRTWPRLGFYQNPIPRAKLPFAGSEVVFTLIPLVKKDEQFAGFPQLMRPSEDKHARPTFVSLDLGRKDLALWDGDVQHYYTGEVGGDFVVTAYRARKVVSLKEDLAAQGSPLV